MAKSSFLGFSLLIFLSGVLHSQALHLHPDNSRYFEYDGKPVLLITSAEHYGAVLNLEFDYISYLKTLKKEGFNYTRIFSGTYLEPVENIFGIKQNTLAPGPGSYIAPWEKEGEKYNLARFNPAYFERLKDFVNQAGKEGVFVEITLFSSIYAENAWKLCPFNIQNNVNGVGDLDHHLVNTLHNGELKKFQGMFIRKLVSELNAFGNIFYEIQNEPWADNPNLVNYVNEGDDAVFSRPWQKKVELANGVSLEWQEWVASVIRETEEDLSVRHLIAQNISNFSFDQERLPEGVSILNFHYALPEAALVNLEKGGVTGLDETGFMPQDDGLYIAQAWRFILSGGGIYNNLDYSFTTDAENGTWPIPEANPGWGGTVFRKKLAYLAETMRSVPFHEMDPAREVIHPAGKLVQHGLAKEGEIYLVFMENVVEMDLLADLPTGPYHLTWLNVHNGEKVLESLEIENATVLRTPFETDQVVLMLQKEN